MHSDALNSQLCRRWLPRGRTDLIVKTDLFDEAVSDGIYTTLLDHADRVAAVDVSPVVATAAVTRHSTMLAATADVRLLPLRDDCADAVVSLSTLDHFTGPDDVTVALLELTRILRPGGVLILTMDNPSNPVLAVRNSLPFSLTHKVGLVPYPVGRTYDVRTMCRMTEEAGLDVTHVTAIMHAPRMLAIQALRLVDGDRLDTHSRLAGTLMAFEKLESLPTRFVTGHFIAIRATKPF